MLLLPGGLWVVDWWVGVWWCMTTLAAAAAPSAPLRHESWAWLADDAEADASAESEAETLTEVDADADAAKADADADAVVDAGMRKLIDLAACENFVSLN